MQMTSEEAFEAAVEAVLLRDGYTRVRANGFKREQAIFPGEALDFIRTTQGTVWEKPEEMRA